MDWFSDCSATPGMTPEVSRWFSGYCRCYGAEATPNPQSPGWWLTHAAYEKAGQFAGFLMNYADGMFESLATPSRRIAQDVVCFPVWNW